MVLGTQPFVKHSVHVVPVRVSVVDRTEARIGSKLGTSKHFAKNLELRDRIALRRMWPSAVSNTPEGEYSGPGEGPSEAASINFAAWKAAALCIRLMSMNATARAEPHFAHQGGADGLEAAQPGDRRR